MAVNKVVYGNQTIIDLTDSTLSSGDQILSGTTAYDRSGVLRSGTAQVGTKIYDGDDTSDPLYPELFMDTVASGVSAVLVGLDMDLLWTNDSPSSSFSAQTISLGLSEYVMFVVACKFNTTSTVIRTSTPFFKNTTTLMYCGIGGSSGSYYECYRLVTFTDGGVEFGAGSPANTNAIPLAIYGIRGQVNDLTGD